MSGMRLAFPFSVAVGLALCATGVGAAGPDPGLNVTVTNPPAQPVPVTLQGTGSITGSVTVTNTPNVSVTNTPTVKVINSAAAQAVVVRFSANLSTTAAGPNFFTTGPFYTVPAGKRLVVEYVDAEYVSPTSNSGKGSLELFTFNPDVSGSQRTHAIGISADFIQCSQTQICVIINKLLRTYADSGSTVAVDGTFVAAQASVGSTSVTGTVNGYLVDIP